MDANLHPTWTNAPPAELPSLAAGANRLAATASPFRRFPQILVLGLLLVTATGIRLTALGENSLTHAEAWRANWSHHGDWGQLRRMPPLQGLMLSSVQHALGRSEWALRLPSACAGVAAVALVYFFVRRLAGLGPALFASTFMAVHPALIAQSRVVKVFSIESLAGAAIAWAGWEVYRKRSTGAITLFAVVSLFATATTFTGPILVAAWLPLLTISLWNRTRRADAATRRAWVLATAALGCATLGSYLWLAGATVRDEVTGYFGTIEPAWPTGHSFAEMAAWLAGSTLGAGRYILGVSEVWPPLDVVIGTCLSISAAAGLGYLWKRQRCLVFFLFAIWIALILAGATRHWPFGEYRTMTFAVPLVALLIGCGLGEFVRSLRRSPATWVLVGVGLLLPATRAVKAAAGAAAYREHLRPVLTYVEEHARDGDALFVYYPADDAFEFYWRRTDLPVLVQPRSDRGRFDAFQNRFAEWIAEHSRVWFVMTHAWAEECEEYLAHLTTSYALADQFTAVDATVHLFYARPTGAHGESSPPAESRDLPITSPPVD